MEFLSIDTIYNFNHNLVSNLVNRQRNHNCKKGTKDSKQRKQRCNKFLGFCNCSNAVWLTAHLVDLVNNSRCFLLLLTFCLVLLILDSKNLSGDGTNIFIFDTFVVNDNTVGISCKFASLERLLTQNAITEK